MNNRKLGLDRDNEILHNIEAFKCLCTDQVGIRLFRGQKAGLRKAQERLLKLHQRGYIERTRVEGQYAYYQGERPGMLLHLLSLNWVRMWIEANLKSWETIHAFNYEPDYSFVRPDAFVSIKNTVNNKHRFAFVEMDRSTNPFDKIPKYCRLFEQIGKYWWTKYTDRFPPVLVVTTTLNRAKQIDSFIQRENKAGLEFQVHLLDKIKGDL